MSATNSYGDVGRTAPDLKTALYAVRKRDDPSDTLTPLATRNRRDTLNTSWTYGWLMFERYGDVWMPINTLHRHEPDPWLPEEPTKRITLPTKPGTVIAIGDWWLVRLRPYELAPSAWELLPMPSKALSEQAERNGARAQCGYGDDWVLAEAEQEGGYEIISQPTD